MRAPCARFGFLNVVMVFCFCAVTGIVTSDARECLPQKFPTTFMWGVSSAGLQSEGNNPASQWTHWATSGHTQDEPGLAADFLHRYKEDIRLAKKMGINTFRIGIEWSRIEPTQGSYDYSAIAFYDDLIGTIVESGMAPIVTLHHFSHPQWFDGIQVSS